MRKLGIFFTFTLLLTSCASSPDRSNDPQSGGFFGGLKGLTLGDYEERVHQKKTTLSIVKLSNERIGNETADITSAQQKTQRKITDLRQKLVSLDSDINDLSRQIADLKQKGTINPQELEELRKIVSALEIDMDDLNQRANQPSARYETLLAQKKQLEKEYRAAIDIFLSLDGI